ncbi:MAG: hypothetical protein U9R16_01935 [Campylobacterota bacterium]|nr:hypothetical protein [Campylobacterota bacterium]
MYKLTKILILASLFFTINISANGKFGSKIFIKCDENKDGFLNQSEYLEMSTKRFKRMDANKDLTVTFTELKNTQLAKIMPKFALSWFSKNDLDENKIVTIKEISKVSNKKFENMDTDNNKLLNSTEWLTNNPSFNKK